MILKSLTGPTLPPSRFPPTYSQFPNNIAYVSFVSNDYLRLSLSDTGPELYRPPHSIDDFLGASIHGVSVPGTSPLRHAHVPSTLLVSPDCLEPGSEVHA